MGGVPHLALCLHASVPSLPCSANSSTPHRIHTPAQMLAHTCHPFLQGHAQVLGLAASAVENLVHCPALTLVGGKLELCGLAPQHAALSSLALARGAGSKVMEGSAGALLALAPLACGSAGHGPGKLQHLKLTGLLLGPQEAEAVTRAVGPSLTQITFSACVVEPGFLDGLAAGKEAGLLPRLATLSIGAACTGLSTSDLVAWLCTAEAFAALTVQLTHRVGGLDEMHGQLAHASSLAMHAQCVASCTAGHVHVSSALAQVCTPMHAHVRSCLHGPVLACRCWTSRGPLSPWTGCWCPPPLS